MGFNLANHNGRGVLVVGDDYYDIETVSGGSIGADPMDALRRHDQLADLGEDLASHTPTGQIDRKALGPAVPAPTNCFAIGLNYPTHVEESSMEIPKVPVVFTKFPGCFTGPFSTVELGSSTTDYEAELVVVIGKGGRNISAGDAWDAVAGLTIGQDVSDRRLQMAATPPHFDLGKSRDTYGPMGPAVVSLDRVPNFDKLAITCEINGEQRQNSTTDQMIFDVPTLIEYLSSIATLHPGDVIFTGTPDGVGAATGNFLRDGDEIVTTIEGLGKMVNTCVAGA